jgi:tRNA(fMet)-specific endonuclease VapC
MAYQVILVDTSILIDYYRKTDKANSQWVALVRQGHKFAISVVTKYEIYSGATPSQLAFWDNVLQAVEVISLDEVSIDTAVATNSSLKRKRKQIDLADLFIAATAITHNLPLATLNKKHFERIDGLQLIK